jgi:hypothetical protein
MKLELVGQYRSVVSIVTTILYMDLIERTHLAKGPGSLGAISR